MREIRQSGSEGGGDETNRLSLPLSDAPFTKSLQARVRFKVSEMSRSFLPLLRSLTVDEPSRNLFENSFRFGFYLFLGLILDRVRDVDRIEV
jgi:hypothetical protein